MKEPLFGKLSTLVMILGILLTPLAGVVTNTGGWGGASWFIGVFVIGLFVTAMVAGALAVIGRFRKEPATIGSTMALLFFMIVSVLAITYYMSGRSERQKERAEYKKMFSKEHWNRIVSITGCPKRRGIGDAGVMSGLWVFDTDNGNFRFVLENGEMYTNRASTRTRKCKNARKSDGGIYHLGGTKYVTISHSDSICPKASALNIESDGSRSVAMVFSRKSGEAIPWKWTKLADVEDLPECKNLSAKEIESLREK